MSSGKIVAIEGLRGYMALMVFVSHLVSTAGLPISFDYVGDFAVAVFIILSGFVIALLLSCERAPYRAFLLRDAELPERRVPG